MSMAVVEKQPVSLKPLVQLCHYRWGAPVVAALWVARGAKFVTLANQLGVSRDALSRTIAGLDELGLVMRNPGYGHPMRPEYLLSPDGESAGPAAHKMVMSLSRMNLADVGGRKWSLPALAAIDAGERRFARVQSLLPDVTARALTQALTQLEEAELIGRTVAQERPPRPEYRLAPRGARLAPTVLRLAKALALQSEE